MESTKTRVDVRRRVRFVAYRSVQRHVITLVLEEFTENLCSKCCFFLYVVRVTETRRMIQQFP